MKNSAALNKRNSSIELLKVFAILLIIAFHFIQTFTLGNPEFPNTEYLIDNYSPTTDVYRFILILMSGFGAVGNMIFFVCSAWFLLDSDRFNKRKEFRLISDVWIISVIIFAAVFFVRGGKIDGLTAVKQFFPITFSNNWYITCYLLFYPIHPFLNIIIGKITQKQHLVAASAMLFIYFGICFLKNDLMFISEFVVWVAAYFIIAYIKIYLKDAASSRKVNAVVLLVCLSCHIGLILLSNIIGLKGFPMNILLHWNGSTNPFLLFAVIAAFNLARSFSFKSTAVNRTSNLSLLIYILHENDLIRAYYRPLAAIYIYEHFGYDRILLWLLVLTVLTFAVCALIGFIYQLTLQKLVYSVGDKIYALGARLYHGAERLILKAH